MHAGALVIAVLIMLAGAALGGVGYRLEQSHAAWRPRVTATADGWRITSSLGLRYADPALSGSYLAWDAGPFTVLVDLRSGHSKLLGVAQTAGAVVGPAVSDRYIVWFEQGGNEESPLYAYDIAAHRRTRLAPQGQILERPAIFGSTLVWFGYMPGAPASAGTNEIRGMRLPDGRQFLVATGDGDSLDTPVISGTTVAWQRRGGSSPVEFVVTDLLSGRRRIIVPAGQTSDHRASGLALSGSTLLWLMSDQVRGVSSIHTYDMTSGASRIVPAGRMATNAAIDGDLIVWAQRDGAATRIMGRRLTAATDVQIAAVPSGLVGAVCVSGDTAAWVVDGHGGSLSGIQTARVPR